MSVRGHQSIHQSINTKKQSLTRQRGVIALITLLSIAIFALAVVTTTAAFAVDELQMANSGNVIDQTYYAAEAGLNEGLYRLITDSAPGNEYDLNIQGVAVNVQVLNGVSATSRRLVSTAIDSNGNQRQVEIIADTSEFGIGLDHAIQGGSGGIFLDNNSVIIGNVYANGDILPASGGARGEIRGNVWAALNEDDGSISTIRGVDVFDPDGLGVAGNVHGGYIEDSNIATSLKYETVDNDTEVAGALCDGNNPACSQTASPPTRSFPLTDADINLIKTEINDAGNPVLYPDAADCPGAFDDGTFYCISGVNQTISNQKIEGNLYVGNGATLTFDGNVYITGDVILDNNGIIRIDPAGDLCTVNQDPDDNQEPNSVLVVVDGVIDINNNYTVEGCLNGTGNVLSYIMLISTTDAGTDGAFDPRPWAIYASNNSESIVFATIHGMLKVKNNGTLNAAVAKKLFLEPNSVVTFNPNFSSIVSGNGGGGANVGTQFGTWHEL